MPHKFTVQDHNRVNGLIYWCNENLADQEWHLTALSIWPAIYEFQFRNSDQHLLAILAS